MILNGIPLSRRSADLLYLPAWHLLSHTLLMCAPSDVAPEYRGEYEAGPYAEAVEAGERYRENIKTYALFNLPVRAHIYLNLNPT